MMGWGINEKNYISAFYYFRQGSKFGDIHATNNLGVMYLCGSGIDKDYKKAYKLLKKAANDGNSCAMHNIGIIHENGYGVKKDSIKAVKYYIKSLDYLNPIAKTSLERLNSNTKDNCLLSF